MKLIGKRIIIRDLEFTDDLDFFEYAQSDRVGPMAGWKPITTIDLARRVLAGYIMSKDVHAIMLKESSKMIGTISIYNYGIRKYNKVKQLGFSLNDSYWNHGYMSEAVRLVIDYIFTRTDCEVLEVGHHTDNFASKRVIEKCGFLYDGRLCKYKRLYDGRLVDADFYSMTREDYERIRRYE